MFSMSSQDTRRKVRLNDLVESRIHGDVYVRFGGECLETYHAETWKGAGRLAYGGHAEAIALFADDDAGENQHSTHKEDVLWCKCHLLMFS